MKLSARRQNYCRAAGLSALTLGLYLPAIKAQTAAFTYQGRSLEGTAPANGSYDLQFGLYALPSGGASLGGFFISRSGAGTSSTRFTPAFADVPVLTLTPYSANAPVTANCNSGSPGGYSTVVTWVGSAKADSWWNFVAVGGR